MLGRAWRGELEAQALSFDAVDVDTVDFSRLESVEALELSGYTLVVNCAAYTDVDGAESNEELATAINADAVGILARRCASGGAKLVHYSTDYVFSGGRQEPYPVDHERQPLNAYGRSKLAGERLVEESGCEALIVRTSWLYAPWGKNFVLTIAGASRTRDELRVVDDQRGRPTSALHLARVSLELAHSGHVGAFHVCDGGECTWFDLASEIVRQRAASCRVVPCSSAEYPRAATRPAYSVLDLSRAEAIVGSMPDWRDNLAVVLGKLPREPGHAAAG